ncbi:helix-turn-helix domain-containing protein [Sphingobium sp. RAC03]|uniref:helix-turn-helix domain-containing protein n=1 Tax=Sphingobium sp. RAC03 TaxID=1843368 RepID=UPI00083DE62C|nr:helix-turn-helix domain-containing protein [Sphingobium sp. RAC03]AOF95376.1 bacterial regulatory s, gntR family protein [Sphingobium sp. RAC03]
MALSVGDAALAALGSMGVRRKPARSGASHRTGAPVRRDSVEAGTFEEAFFAVPAKGETDRLLHVARKTLDAARRLRRDERAGAKELSAAERLIARLTSSAVRVYEEILTLARLNRGQVFPSYDHLADATGLGRATICRALTILEAIGFLARQRRFNRVEGQGPGPRYKQTSNAYRPLLPAKVLSYLPRWLRPAPVPEDEVQRRLDHIDDTQLMLKSLSCRELAEATVDGPLRKILAKLGDAIDRRERESQTGSEPLTDSYINRLKGVGLAGQRLNA